MASELKRAYLISGDDEAKILAAITRLRGRAEREQGEGALERIGARPGAAPDLDQLAAELGTLSLTATHRYVLLEGAERIGAGDTRALATILESTGDDVTLVLVARGPAKPALAKTVEAAGGDVLAFEAPKRKDLPRWVADEGRRRGVELAPAAVKALIDRVGERTARLTAELDRLAVWAEPEARIEREDVAASVADVSEEALWTLSDAIIDRRPDLACRAAERLLEQEEAIPGIVYGTAKSLRRALDAAEQLRGGAPAGDVSKRLGIHPYAAKKLVQRVSRSSPEELREALSAFAELEWETRGGSSRDERAALVLAVREAAGA